MGSSYSRETGGLLHAGEDGRDGEGVEAIVDEAADHGHLRE